MNDKEQFTDLHPKGSPNDIQHFDLERELVRPVLHFKRVLIKTVAVFITATVFGILAKIILNSFYCKRASMFSFLVSGLIIILAIIIKLKSILIWLIMVYQKFAPERVRLRCVFNPSCSEYMILAIEKYGVIKGIYKGIKRLKRCHLPNFGDDFP